MVQTIHHTQMKKARQMGIQLDPSDEMVRAFWPARNLSVFGVDAKNAMQQMQAAVKLIEKHEAVGDKIALEPDADVTKKRLVVNGVRYALANTPMAWGQIDLEKWAREESESNEPEMDLTMGEIHGPDPSTFIEDMTPTINGVPTSGRAAHEKGFMTPDCPFPTGGEEETKWLDEWETSADEADAAQSEEEKEPTGSVVRSKFRAKYAELGHPTHCGDELAVKLNNLVGGSKVNIEYFQMILAANDVDMSKYKTEGPGWQGRFRMTGRIKLAKALHSNGGVLKVPNGEELRMSQDWLDSQRFKKG